MLKTHGNNLKIKRIIGNIKYTPSKISLKKTYEWYRENRNFLMIKVYYWAPCIDKVATVKAVINSAKGFNKYYSKIIEPTIINSIGEWNAHKNCNLDFCNLTQFNFFKIYLPKDS